MVARGNANAVAMRAASMPSTVFSMRGVRMAGSIAGWAQTNSNSSLLSGIASGSTEVMTASRRSSGSIGIEVRTAAEPSTSRRRFRATVSSHASGLSGTPAAGQVRSARSKASSSTSSASARSRVVTARRATRRP
jgi:hypothetical protein